MKHTIRYNLLVAALQIIILGAILFFHLRSKIDNPNHATYWPVQKEFPQLK
jgi:hypothetical protein